MTEPGTSTSQPTPDEGDPDEDRSLASRFREWIWETVRTWGPALLTVLLIRSVIAEPFRIPSGSMVPTLEIGDHILVTKFTYGLRIPLTRIPLTELKVPERGDVVVFVYPGSDEGKLAWWVDLPFPGLATYDYVKRVVGLPGDEIEVRDNVVSINGVAMEKTEVGEHAFVDDRCRTNPTIEYTEDLDGIEHKVLNTTHWSSRTGRYGPETVPEGHIFVMGDNRDHSADSRSWGYVPLRNIKGKSRFVWLSYDVCHGTIPYFGSFRGDRVGAKVQ